MAMDKLFEQLCISRQYIFDISGALLFRYIVIIISATVFMYNNVTTLLESFSKLYSVRHIFRYYTTSVIVV